MSATAQTSITVASQLSGLFKEVYAERLLDLIPDNAILLKMISFSERKGEGNYFNQPVVVTQESGATFAAPGDGAFYLMASNAMVTQNALLQGYQIYLRGTMDLETAFKSNTSKKAFVKGTELIVESLLNSMTKLLEIETLYGQSGLAIVDDCYDLSDDNSLALQVRHTDWAPGIWAAAENCYINLYSGATIQGTQGTNKALGTADLKISQIDFNNHILTVTGDATVLSNLNTTLASSGNGLTIYWKDSYGKSAAGINKILTNTGSLFNINAETYSSWKANTYAISGAITQAGIIKSLSTPQARGLRKNAVLLLNPDAWGVLNSEAAALRTYDSSYKAKGENGFEALTFRSQNGLLEVISHPCVKKGDGFVFPKDSIKRLGPTDITFKHPLNGDDFFRPLTDRAGFELGVYSNQAYFIEYPAHCSKLTGITS